MQKDKNSQIFLLALAMNESREREKVERTIIFVKFKSITVSYYKKLFNFSI